MHPNDSRRRAIQELRGPLCVAAIAVLIVALASLAYGSSEPEAAPAAGEPHHGAVQQGDAHSGSAHAGAAHAAAHPSAHGPAQAEKIHNWFGFAERKTYAPIGWAIVNFAILIFLLFKFAGPSFRKFLTERHEAAKAALEEAARLRAQAQQRLAEIEQRVKNLDTDIAQIKKDVAADAEREKQTIIAAAEAEATRIVEVADRTMAEDLKRVHAELEVEAVRAAMAAAELILKQQVNDADHARLHKEYLAQLGPGGGN